MKNKKIWLVLLVMVLAFGMMVVGCPVEAKGGGGGGGTLTITDIPATYNGKYASFHFIDTYRGITIIGCQSLSTTSYTLAKISNGSVALPLWSNFASRYTGNDTVSGEVFITNYEIQSGDTMEPIGCLELSVTFVNGNATKTWTDGTFTPSTLTSP